MERIICVFGDSTAWGAWDTEKGGWVERLWLDLAKGSEGEDYFEVYNLSVSGGTSQTILERFENEAKIRNATSLIIQTGGNDSSQNASGEFTIPIEKFRENIEEIILRAKKITSEVILIGGKDVYEKLANPVPWADAYYRLENIQKYNIVIKEACEKEGALYMEMPELEESDFADGVHLNPQGHEKVFIKVRGFLKENNWIV
jgi:lysophospholipase L1-like esterase